MTAAVGIASSLQVGGGGGAAPSEAFECLTLLVGLSLLSILSFFVLKVRSLVRRSGKEKPDFTSMRSTGKTIVNAAPPDDDADQFGSVN